MTQLAYIGATESNFDLKRLDVALLPTQNTTATRISTEDLEAMRTSGAIISASRHGLEAITGASCETGAQ